MDNYRILIGTHKPWGKPLPVYLTSEGRRTHVHVIGKTGMGKSTLLKNMILQDIEAGSGVGLIDPHGDLASEVLECIPSWRTDHVVYFNPADTEYPIGLNLLRAKPGANKPLIASGVVGAFRSIWRDSWGPRLEYILYATVASLLECDNVSLLGVQRVISDPAYRRWVVKQVKDPAVKSFWINEFDRYDERFLREAVAPIQNKVGQLLMSPVIRNIVGQVRQKINFSFMMDNRRIFIANLSKGLLGEDKARLLGALLVTQFQLAAMARSRVPESDRRDYPLYIDEFQNFATDSFTSILAEARKYRLNLTSALS